MADNSAFLEAHSYSGGLRHTPLGVDARPSWAPPPEEVGWRDDFELDADDTIVEFNQRGTEAQVVSWLAVYKRSVDAQFGDRQNHAGIGVWLHGSKVADAKLLLLALHDFAALLAKKPDPQTLTEHVKKFDSFLQSYIIPADALPRTWTGSPPSSALLVDTDYKFVSASSFKATAQPVAEEITRLSVGWTGLTAASRSVILISRRKSPPTERKFTELGETGQLLADILEALPKAFEDERALLRQAENQMQTAKADWEAERMRQEAQLAADREELQKLDGLPATPEAIAIRLNTISSQLSEYRFANKAVLDPTPVERPRIQQAKPRRVASATPQRYEPSDEPHTWAMIALGVAGIAIVLVIVFLIFRSDL